MSTTTAANNSEITETDHRVARPRRIGRLRGLVLAGLMAFGFVGALGVVDAAPASAASSVTACFRWSNGTAYANQPMKLYTYNPSTGRIVSLVRNGRSNASGCGTFSNTPTNQNLVAVASFGTDFQYWEGWSPRYALPGQSGANLGTGTVYRIW